MAGFMNFSEIQGACFVNIFEEVFLMETSEKEKVVKALDALKELVADDEKATSKPASEEETQNFQPIADLRAGDKLRFKGGIPLKFPEKNEEVYVYSTDLPAVRPESDTTRIRRNDFSFIVVYSDGDVIEFPMDSRYFERV
jgi:hypothetical protein